jgi:hypothetical protein
LGDETERKDRQKIPPATRRRSAQQAGNQESGGQGREPTTSHEEITQMSTTNLYPFVSKSTVKAQLEGSYEFRLQAMTTLLAMQTTHEQATESTVSRNRVGFMSSHAKHGTRIAKLIADGQPLTDEDVALVNTIAPRYSRQIASFMRDEAIRQNPELAKTAALFSVKVPADVTDATDEADVAAE